MGFIKLSAEEHQKLDESLEILQSLFIEQLQDYKQKKAVATDNEFIKTIGEKYLTPSGLLDLLEDYQLLTESQPCTCSGPCKATCVNPCRSRINATP